MDVIFCDGNGKGRNHQQCTGRQRNGGRRWTERLAIESAAGNIGRKKLLCRRAAFRSNWRNEVWLENSLRTYLINGVLRTSSPKHSFSANLHFRLTAPEPWIRPMQSILIWIILLYCLVSLQQMIDLRLVEVGIDVVREFVKQFSAFPNAHPHLVQLPMLLNHPGKRPTDESLKEGLTLRKMVETALPEKVMDIIDQSLLSEESREDFDAKRLHECLVLVLHIGLSCSKDLPNERMDIRLVLRELHAIRDTMANPSIQRQEDRLNVPIGEAHSHQPFKS